jgi:methylenetetrahydrofolate dehydrogenase (NADP+)/methenyltetrahydrofolate cyclohydrolase
MTARRLGGRDLASEVRAEVAARLRVHLARGGRAPRLVAFAVAPTGGERAYLETQARAAEAAGFTFRLEALHASTDTAAARERLARLSADPEVDGVLVSWPLPPALERERVLEALDPRKDVDALSPAWLGRLAVDPTARAPATARAVMAILAQAGVDLGRSRVTLVGAGRTAGLPTLLLLLGAGAQVRVVHRPEHGVEAAVRDADVVVAAAGRPGVVSASALRPGAVVVDVGVTEVEGRLLGDVAGEVAAVASAYTPVPGGVGPVTVSYLLLNALEAVGA